MIPGDRLLCVLLDSHDEGEEFMDWPLHITIVPWFRTSVATDKLAGELRSSLKGRKAFIIDIDGEAHFGGRRKLVNLVRLPTPLTDIEQTARQMLRTHDAWMVDETTKVRRPFRPHVTAQKLARAQQGDKIMCDNLYIIEQKGESKTVAARIEL